MSIGVKVVLTLAVLAVAVSATGAVIWVMFEWLDPFSIGGTIGFVALFFVAAALVFCAIAGSIAIWNC